MQLVNSFKRFSLILLFLTVAAFSVVIVFDQLIAAPTNLDFVLVQTGKTLIVFFFGAVILFFIRHAEPLMAR